MAHTTNGTRLIAPHRFSNVVGAIYDCAIDPERWPEALHAICADLKCLLGAIYLVDLQRSHIRCVKIWNVDAGQVEQILQNKEYREDLMFHIRQWPIDTQPIDEPMAYSRVVDIKEAKSRHDLLRESAFAVAIWSKADIAFCGAHIGRL